MRKHRFKILIVSSICFIFILFIIFTKISLKQPVYYRYLVTHYLPTVADSVYFTSTIELIYITNSWDKKQVTSVTFEDCPELKVLPYTTYSKKYGTYKVMTTVLYLEWDQDAVDVLPDVVEVNKIIVEYSNQTSQSVDIGRLSIYSGDDSDDILEAVGGMPLVETERLQLYEAQKNVMINGFSPTTLEIIKEADIIESLSLTYNNYDLIQPTEPIMLERTGILEFIMKIKGSRLKRLMELKCKYDFYEIDAQIEFYKEEGSKHFVTVFNYPIKLEFDNFFDVRKYLKWRD